MIKMKRVGGGGDGNGANVRDGEGSTVTNDDLRRMRSVGCEGDCTGIRGHMRGGA